MAIDVVHDLQEVYRQVLQTMSRPGHIENIREITKKNTISAPCYSSTIILAMTLLDAEVSFHVVGKKALELAKHIAELTLAQQKTAQDADYLFITSDAQEETIKNVILQTKAGTLLNPQASATIILETKQITNEGSLCLSGPGIEDTESLYIAGAHAWLEERDVVNKEYPLGIDFIFVDEEDNVVSLPRTTKIENREVK